MGSITYSSTGPSAPPITKEDARKTLRLCSLPASIKARLHECRSHLAYLRGNEGYVAAMSHKPLLKASVCKASKRPSPSSVARSAPVSCVFLPHRYANCLEKIHGPIWGILFGGTPWVLFGKAFNGKLSGSWLRLILSPTTAHVTNANGNENCSQGKKRFR